MVIAPFSIRALIANPNVITTLNHLAAQENTELGREIIEVTKNRLQPNQGCTIS